MDRQLHFAEDSDMSTTETATAFGDEELRRATNNFSEANKLAEGSFGVVYRGRIDDGREVAIKMLKLTRQQQDAEKQKQGKGGGKYTGVASFRREADILGKYRHPNLVALLGHGGCHGASNKQRPSLVYAFMDGKELRTRLRAAGGGGGFFSRAHADRLSATERAIIASDVARGLEFLHTICDPPIVHQDVKTANILLGRTRTTGRIIAKLADFGVARVLPTLSDGDSHVSTRHIVGTGPYMAPEYFQAGRVSVKTDSFAFGVVMLELLTGHGAINAATRMPLADEMLTKISGTAAEMSSKLKPLLDSKAGKWNMASAVRLAMVARRCIDPRSHERCTVAEVRQELDQVACRNAMTMTSTAMSLQVTRNAERLRLQQAQQQRQQQQRQQKKKQQQQQPSQPRHQQAPQQPHGPRRAASTGGAAWGGGRGTARVPPVPHPARASPRGRNRASPRGHNRASSAGVAPAAGCRCTAPLVPGAKFCTYCGAPVPVIAQPDAEVGMITQHINLSDRNFNYG